MKNIPQNIIAMFSLSLVLLGPTMACLVESASTKASEPSQAPLSMCPSEGANLYLKCADGRERAFGVGYHYEPLYVREEGKWFSREIEEFCKNEIAEIKFYFGKSHLQVSGQKANGDIVRWAWQSAQSACALFEPKVGLDYATLKIKSIPITSGIPAGRAFYEPSKLSSLCPSKGTNLYLRCADGREKVFAVGYKSDPFYIRKQGKLTLLEAEEFCRDNISEIRLYFTKAHFRWKGQKSWGLIVASPWFFVDSDCIESERSNYISFVNLKIESVPISNGKPADDPE